MLQFVPMNGYQIKPVISDPHKKRKKKKPYKKFVAKFEYGP